MKIEEITDDLAETKLSAEPQNGFVPPPPPADLLTQAMNAFVSTPNTDNEDGTTGPSLPPGMAAMKGKSGPEILADLNKSPLFMTELEENDDLEALKALAYEGTPYEVGLNFKERGNESFKEKGWGDAREFYGQGIQILLLEVRKRQKGEDDTTTDKEEIMKEVGMLEQLLVNRAACHLELRNYRSCVQDCENALKINGRNVKAYYRSARAYLKMDKVAEADDACAKGLEIDSSNKALQDLATEVIRRHEEVQKRKQKELERENRIKLEAQTLRAALKARGITTRKTAQPPEMEDAKIELVPDPVDPSSSISFPAVLLYPLELESDFIKSLNETQSVGEHLSYILPLPWDKRNEYTPNGVKCYMETVMGGLIKIGKKASLLRVLSGGKVEVVDEVVKIFVVPKTKAEAWVADFKRKKAAEKTASGSAP